MYALCAHVCAFIIGSLYFVLLNLSDVNECGLDKGGCDHKCINRGGSYHCACAEGYSLQSDNRTCVAGIIIIYFMTLSPYYYKHSCSICLVISNRFLNVFSL